LPGSSPSRVQAISGIFDIENTEARFRFVRALIHDACLCMALRAQVGERGPISHFAKVWNGSIVTVAKDGVLKFIVAGKDKNKNRSQSHDPNVDLAILKDLYRPGDKPHDSLLNGILHCVSMVDAEIWRSTWTLKPRGAEWDLSIRALALRALRDTARALAALHAKGWVHRNVRWPNILQLDDGGFMLIDFEYAAPIDTKVTWRNDKHQPEETRPSNTTSQLGWQPKHDMWQIGVLLTDAVVGDSIELIGLRADLLATSDGAENFAKRAVAALEGEMNCIE
jgi:serine/threonine protein kinase